MAKALGLWMWRAALACVLTAQLVGCLGGGGDDDAVTEPPPAEASLQGAVQREGDGTPVAGATASVAAAAASAPVSTTTDAAGLWALQALSPGQRVVLRVQAPGYAPALRVLDIAAGSNTVPTVYLQPEGVRQQVDPAQAATIADQGTGALLSVPANGWRREDGAALSGALTVVLTAVQPAQDASRMPGDYTALSATGSVQRLESFGAVSVQVSDAQGRAVNLAPGVTAELRIPASSRARTLPATVGLYALDERTGRWKAEGSATLAGNGTQQWYTASVTHLSWWNADQPQDTVFVDGCLRDALGAAAPGRSVVSDGLDYTGRDTVQSDAGGRFRVGIKRGGQAQIGALPAAGAGAAVPVAVGPSQADITLTTCLAERTAGLRAPALLAQPEDVVVIDGGDARFAVQVDGSAPLRYQWLRNGQALPGATGPVLRLASTRADDGAVFALEVSNAAGQVTSRSATLTVLAFGATPPVIGSEPADLRVEPGAQARFAVLATGAAPLAYQWLRNGQALAGANGSELVFTATATDDGARYSVRVSNALGSTTSREALLGVGVAGTDAPTITANPVSITVQAGATATFSVQASGSGPLHYRWLRNGAEVVGATGPSLSFTAAAGDNGARYTAVVSNSAGSVSSSSATLTVGGVMASGTLTVGGDAASITDGSFTPNGTPNEVQLTGPLCSPNAPTIPCQSIFLLLAREQAPGSPSGVYEQLTLGIGSVAPSPGAAPGTQPTTVTIGFVAIKTSGGTVVSGVYELNCKAGETPCGDPADSGVVVDAVQRTITFTQVTLAVRNDPSRTTTLNGTLRY